jgi:hypothetical protein
MTTPNLRGTEASANGILRRMHRSRPSIARIDRCRGRHGTASRLAARRFVNISHYRSLFQCPIASGSQEMACVTIARQAPSGMHPGSPSSSPIAKRLYFSSQLSHVSFRPEHFPERAKSCVKATAEKSQAETFRHFVQYLIEWSQNGVTKGPRHDWSRRVLRGHAGGFGGPVRGGAYGG